MSDQSLTDFVAGYFERLKAGLDGLPMERLEQIGEVLFRAYCNSKQVFIVGNGGSAATASHMACDLGKNTISPNRPRFRIMSLNDNVPLLSALANDLGYERVFAEQLVNLIRPGDILISISGSGRSPNILHAMRYAHENGAINIAFLGFDGGPALELADEYILVASDDYGVIEDVHMVVDHVLTGYFKLRVSQYELATV
jgi:D-sedoheptulose 7-phosphate isomerase